MYREIVWHDEMCSYHRDDMVGGGCIYDVSLLLPCCAAVRILGEREREKIIYDRRASFSFKKGARVCVYFMVETLLEGFNFLALADGYHYYWLLMLMLLPSRVVAVDTSQKKSPGVRGRGSMHPDT